MLTGIPPACDPRRVRQRAARPHAKAALGAAGASGQNAAVNSPTRTGALPTLEDIQRAAARLRGHLLDTPCVESRTLSSVTGCQVFLKFENLQFTASFKERGACNKLAAMLERGEHPRVGWRRRDRHQYDSERAGTLAGYGEARSPGATASRASNRAT